MSRKRSVYKPKAFESRGLGKIKDSTLSESFASIYESMLLSEAWQSLTDRQKNLYLLCKAQYYGHRKPNQDFKDMESLDSLCFYLPRKMVITIYKAYKPSMERYLYKDMRVLEERGFLDLVASGRANHSKSIYRYSSRWQTWTNKETK